MPAGRVIGHVVTAHGVKAETNGGMELVFCCYLGHEELQNHGTGISGNHGTKKHETMRLTEA